MTTRTRPDGRDPEQFALMPASPVSDTVRRAAALVICGHATDHADARHLLDVTGLLDQPPPRFTRATPRHAAKPVPQAHRKRGKAR